MANMTDKIAFPEYETLDPNDFEVFLDIDLDQLTVLFYGLNRRHSTNPHNDVLSVLEDPVSGEVLGIALSRFARQVLVERPQMIAMAAAATILAGEQIIPPGEFYRYPVAPSFTARLGGSFRAARLAWKEAENHEPKVHSIYNYLLQFA